MGSSKVVKKTTTAETWPEGHFANALLLPGPLCGDRILLYYRARYTETGTAQRSMSHGAQCRSSALRSMSQPSPWARMRA